MDNNEVAELLETTADRFESGVYEWHRNDLCDLTGGYCSVGALSYTATGRVGYNVPEVTVAARAMIRNKSEAINQVLRECDHSREMIMEKFAESILVTWNDVFAKDKAEVVELMKQAAKDLRNDA